MVVATAVCLLPVSACADGGTLLRQPIPERQLVLDSWTAQVSFTSEEKASMEIPGATGETDVFVVDTSGDPPLRFYVTPEERLRLLFDSNRDGEIQAGEVHESDDAYSFLDLEDFEIPYPVRESVPSLRVGFYAYTHEGGAGIYIHSVREWYRGKVRIDEKEYEACLFFRFPVPDPDICNEAVILDTDGDGLFNPFRDRWMAAEGIASFDNRLWVASTVFSGSSAEFAVEPYSGPLGRIRFTGKGVDRVHIWLTAKGVPALSSGKAAPVCLPAASESAYEIPPGFCRVDEVWLRPEKDSSVLYYCDPPVSGEIPGATANVVADGTASVAVGGPLTDSVMARRYGILSRFLVLDYQNCTNPAGFSFEAVVSSGPWAGFRTPEEGPPYEIHTAAGRLIDSGNFDYG
jgi:hypothetical protein